MALHPIFADVIDTHLRATKAVTQCRTYRGWDIRRGRWPDPEWMAVHPNYDASWEGEEDGWVDNGMKADAPTYEALCDEIDEIEDERFLAARAALAKASGVSSQSEASHD